MKDLQLVTSSSGPLPKVWPLRGMSIRTRLILLVLSVLLPALVGGWWVVGLTYRLERQANERLLEETSRAIAMVLDRELAARAVVVRGLSLSRMLDGAPNNLSQDNLLAFDNQARRTLQGFQGWLEVRSADRLLVDTSLPPDTLPTDIPSPAPALDTPGLQRSAQVQPLRSDPQKGGYHAALVQPLERNGQTVLNLKLTIQPEEFQRIIDQQNLAPDWVAAVIDNENRVVARHPGGVTYAGRSATPDLQARIAQKKESLMESVSLDGVPVMAYYSTSPQGWTYLTAMPRAQFVGEVPKAVINVGLGALVLLVLGLMGSLRVSRSIAEPITQLKRLAHRMQAGQALQAEPTGILECDEVTRTMACASQSIRESHSELQHQVAEAVARTRQAEQRLSHSQRVEALGRLTGGVAHDFNNLLGVISNSAHLIQRHAHAPELQAPVQATLRAVDLGSRLTQHLLRFAGRQAVSPRQIDLSQALPETAELLKTVLGSRVTLSVEVAPATPAVSVDPSELELSLINLALNARDAIAQRGQLWVRAARAEPADTQDLPAGDYVIITVSDNGCGIDEATAEHVFEPFFSTKTSDKGTGLGLSQVYGFCQQAGGVARLDSTPGLGTTVSLLLPASRLEAVLPDTPVATVADDTSIVGARLLLIDDNEALRRITAALLSSFGFVVTLGATAADALRLVHSEAPFDVVLTDVLMPGDIDGVALAKRLRQDLPKLAVVLISGHCGKVDLSDGFPLLRKPCAPEVLVATLREAIRTARVS